MGPELLLAATSRPHSRPLLCYRCNTASPGQAGFSRLVLSVPFAISNRSGGRLHENVPAAGTDIVYVRCESGVLARASS